MSISHKPFLIIISSPSGAGKSTLCSMVISNDDNIKLSISTTTRAKRPKEIDGKDYHFIDKNKFQEMVDNAEFLEYATVFENSYGTPKKVVEEELKKGNEVIFDIDWQGARQVKEKFSADEVISIFILPPSLVELKKRLESRAQDDEKTVLKRMAKAQDEISHFNEYDYILINENLNDTYQKIRSIIQAKRIARVVKSDLSKFILEKLS